MRRVPKRLLQQEQEKHQVLLLFLIGILLFIMLSLNPLVAAPAMAGPDYVILGWNNLGMHCFSPSFKQMAILPPYNNLWVQVIKKGDPPQVVTSGINVEYSIVNNTTVQGKTDFWQYVSKLFGVSLPPGIGLTGNGLFGTMQVAGNPADHFEATGIPVLPYNDQMKWNPYQVAKVELKNRSGKVLESTSVVLPVSDELNCAMCHATGADASANYGIDTGTLEGNILAIHDTISHTSLMANQPVLCAGCHDDYALGKEGGSAQRSLSEAMHTKHSSLLDIGYTDLPGCYDCHPGALTQCTRTAIGGMGYVGNTPSCPSCHGELAQVGESIGQGRLPWRQEPTCEQCHGDSHTTGGNLYQVSKGHGGVLCSGCHNSPHAWWPSKLAVDNLVPQGLQKTPFAIRDCRVCHTAKKVGNSPMVTYLFNNGIPK
jgi:hypothetical protein